jgi:hypothetical protein
MKTLFLAITASAALLCACSTPEKMAKLQGKGPARIYPASYAATWKAAVDSTWGLGLTVLRVYPDQGFISAKRGMSGSSLGENVGIWLRDAGEGKTQVEVLNRQKGIPVLLVKNWEEDLFRAIGEQLNTSTTAQGSAPGVSGVIVGSSANASPALVTPLSPQANAPIVQPPKVKVPPNEELLLRERLKTFLSAREMELKTETDPTRRKLLKYETEYLRDELDKAEAKTELDLIRNRDHSPTP